MLKDLNPYVRFIDKCENARYGHETIASDCRFIYVLKGSCELSFCGKRHHIKEGDAVYFPPREPYLLRGQSSSSLLVVRFDPWGEKASDGGAARSQKRIFAPLDRPLLVSGVDCRESLHMLESCVVLPSRYATDHASCLMKGILLLLAEQSEKEEKLTSLTRRILDYVEENFASPSLTNQDIAARFGYHPYHISRVVRSETGKTLKAYIIWYRLQVAAGMLSFTDTPIADVAHASGFESQSYFSKMFREEFGCTPGEYRKAHTQGDE